MCWEYEDDYYEEEDEEGVVVSNCGDSLTLEFDPADMDLVMMAVYEDFG